MKGGIIMGGMNMKGLPAAPPPGVGPAVVVLDCPLVAVVVDVVWEVPVEFGACCPGGAGNMPGGGMGGNMCGNIPNGGGTGGGGAPGA